MAELVNAKRRSEVLKIYRNPEVFDYIKKARRSEEFQEGKKKGAKLRKVATVPVEVDIFFTRIYGSNYYKDPEFFSKRHPEWRVVDRKMFGREEDNINLIAKGLRSADA